jgi:hypothetical protein
VLRIEYRSKYDKQGKAAFNAGARGVRDVAPIHYPSCTDSVKPSLQFSCNFVVINSFDGSICFKFFTFFITWGPYAAFHGMTRKCQIEGSMITAV